MLLTVLTHGDITLMSLHLAVRKIYGALLNFTFVLLKISN